MNPNINEDNKATRFGSGLEAVSNGKKGGEASGIARREYRRFREGLKQLLPMLDTDKNGNTIINPVTGEPQTIQMTIILNWLKNARKGKTKDIKLILDTLGELVLKEEHKHEGDVTIKLVKTGYAPASSEEEILKREGMDGLV